MELIAVLVLLLVPCFVLAKVHPSPRLHRKTNSRRLYQTLTAYSVLSPKEVINRLLHYYNDQEPPMKDRPTEVQLGIYINSFYSISEQTMDYSVSMYLRQVWRDPRLSFPPIHGRIREVRLGEANLNHVWIPDTFFRNEKKATFHEVTIKNRLMRLNATGHIWYVTKISATLSCPMRLQRYPLDTQKCPMMFESFGYTMDTLYFTWIDKTVEIERNLQMPQFSMTGYVQYDCSQNYTAGAFPCLEIRFVLRRDVGYFLIQVYVPSMLIVILSWVSFWINVDASPARVSIGLLTVLTTTTQSSQSTATLPRVSYIKAIDVWMSACLVFVFAALLEYALVNVLSRRRGVRIINPTVGGGGGGGTTTAAASATDQQEHHVTGSGTTGHHNTAAPKRPRLFSMVPRLEVEDQMDQTTGIVSQKEQHTIPLNPLRPTKIVDNTDGKMKARRVDKFARKCFPLAFVLFNIVYWMAYTIPSEDEDVPGSTN